VNWGARALLTLGVCGLAVFSHAASVLPPVLRTTVSLDGTWEVEDGVSETQFPGKFRHNAPVPGLVHSSTPAFAQVDEFRSKQLLSSLVYYDRFSQADYDELGDIRGTTNQTRKYFWYRRSFRAPARSAIALIKVSKAQFGTVVYLNGVRIGEHDSCFTAGYFDVSGVIRWNASNVVVIRIGAHPGVLPPTVIGGTDFEKYRWTPGIYDSVSLITANNPVISVVQVAPRLANVANVASILVQTELHNYSAFPIDTELAQSVFEWKSGRPAAVQETMPVHLEAGEIRQVTQVVPIPAAHLWSPEDPFLYRVVSRTAGDETQTRFGMREFHFDTVTRRGYLNGQPYFLRGSNIALHRFFEDPQSGTLPWNESWVRRLLVTIPKQMHWNAFRFTIGPVPERWLEIADENGLLIEYEYPVWVGSPVYTQWRSSYDTNQMIREYSEWMRDSWNHPSIFLWDATNESWLPEFASKVIPTVRSLDLSNRSWENSYNAPGGPDDPVEDHNYFLEAVGGKFDATGGGKPFELSDLQSMDGVAANPFTKSNHAKIVNEYGWIWLNRDGSPTLLTQNLFPKLLGGSDTVESRRALSARVLAGETELFRAYREYAGVMHFAYLTSSEPGGFTSDNFVNIQTLELEPHFAAEMEQAFRPLGVYLNFWQPTIPVKEHGSYEIYLVNDEDRLRAGVLRLVFTDPKGIEAAATTLPFSVPPLGAQSYTALLTAPVGPGHYVLQALAAPQDDAAHPTVSTRDVVLESSDRQK
jgi:beta-galactosidase